SLKVTAASDSVYNISTGQTEKEYIYGKSTITLKTKDKKSTYIYEIDVKSYAEYYADKKMNDYIKSKISSTMTNKQKMNKICQFPTMFDYSADYSSATGMIISGGGDCWASTDAIIKICKKLGIDAWVRNGNKDPGAGSGHINAMAKSDGEYYELEAGFNQKAPRDYIVTKRTTLFSFKSYDSDSVEVYQYDGKPGFKTITVPSKINGMKVKSIGTTFITFNSSLKKVVLPNTLEHIGISAFYGCENLESVNVPASVRQIDMNAFSGCNKLNLTVDEKNNHFSVDNKAGILYSKNKESLICAYNLKKTDITIPNGVKYIEDSAFYQTNLKSVRFPDTLIDIGYCAFAYTSMRGFDIVLPESVNGIGYGAFYESNAKSITFLNPNCEINNTVENNLKDNEDGKTLMTNDSEDAVPTVIYGEKGSTAQKYVSQFGTVTYKWTGSNGKVEYQDVVLYKFQRICYSYLQLGKHDFGKSSVIKEATCEAEGRQKRVCQECGYAETKSIPKTSHKTKISTTKATSSKNGKVVSTCTVCKKVTKTTVIPKVSSISLSAKKYIYNGKVKAPSVTVKDSMGKVLKKGTDYTVSYASGRKNTGKYAVKITFKGNYSGSKTLYFNILPSKTSKLSVSQTTSSIKATWKAVTGATGYKVTLYNAKGKAVKTVDTTKTTYTFTKLSKGTTYKVRVTAYKTIDGKKVSSSVYTQLTTATKPGTPTLKVKAGAKKASLSWNKQTGASGYVVYMATSKNGTYKKIATVKGGTKVSYTKTGLTKGKTYYFKVKAYKTVGEKNIYGAYSAVKYAKIK
ncbi:MAG: leucine-rich repeat protein, partial [Acutalibacteraceae bacterium]